CVDTPAGLEAALEGGADRIELCSALALGGLTPSVGLMALAAQTQVPVRAMIRPREGHFIFDAAECDMMLRDIDAARVVGLEGVVIGASTESGGLDMQILKRLAAHAAGMAITLHRVVDLLNDPTEAVDLAIALNLSTILTSGGAARAIDGLDGIAAMQDRAGDRIEILAGGGVTAENVLTILAATGIGSVHASCSRPAPAATSRLLELGFEAANRRMTDRAVVAALRHATRA
ncbi:copper homeostasis protein CutC, partial [Sphingobium sp.]|uniref:copper homeostasis protein CutC n=1 Tax=Sphingobium sp. TaxID=1912891 RepID=UPI002C675484